MNQLAIIEETPEFFAPISADQLKGLLDQHKHIKERISCLSDAVKTENDLGAMSYFFDGYTKKNGDRYYTAPSLDRLFDRENAVKALDAAYWNKAIEITDLMDYMPTKRRDEWQDQIRTLACPPFDDLTVYNTIKDLMDMRFKFLAEKVDGIFRGLSGDHVTNSPAGFGKRMIVANVLDGYGMGSVNYTKSGLLHDLRWIVARLRGISHFPRHAHSAEFINGLKGAHWGEWVPVDGGAIRMRLYMKGTLHLEVHPDVAWKLNAILSSLYPKAIPAEFRQKPTRKPKDVQLMQVPLPFNVLRMLHEMKPAREETDDFRNPTRYISNTRAFGYVADEKSAAAKIAKDVLESIGGVLVNARYFEFDYDPSDVIAEIVTTGCVPDQYSHQFYPTPEDLAQEAVDLAEIGPNHICLEPSAGLGGLAKFMPKQMTWCFEISELRVKAMKAMGLMANVQDFLKYKGGYFDRIVMNPPFDQGRWQAHLTHAFDHLENGGRLVAILPSGAQSRSKLPAGIHAEWHGPYADKFKGASVDVVILVADKKEQSNEA